MIQRIQSLYLLLGAICLFTFLFLDLAWTSPAAELYPWFTPAVLALSAVTGLGALIAIVLFGDRQRQRKFVLSLQVVTVVFLFVLFGGLFLAGDLHLMRGGETAPGKIVAMVLPVVAYVFFYLAKRGIESDIALVRSMDRLR